MNFLDTIKRAFSSARTPGHAITLNGDLVIDFVQQTGPANYATGGFVPDVGKFGLSSVLAVISDNAGGYEWTWDGATKIKVFTSGGAETANATNLSALATTLMVIGRR